MPFTENVHGEQCPYNCDATKIVTVFVEVGDLWLIRDKYTLRGGILR
jgi:hypothetical protein